MKIDIKKITDKDFFKCYKQAINLLGETTEEDFLSFKDNCFYGSRDDVDYIFYDNDGLTFIITIPSVKPLAFR